MIKVLKPGFYSTIQDAGRFEFQEYGVPYSGAMDTYAASMANMVLGNSENAAVLEMTMTGPTLQFDCETIICLSGADMSPVLNDVPLVNNKAIHVPKNAVLSFGKLNDGFRGYLSVSGGFKTDKVMGSRSMFKGVTEHCVIAKGDELSIKEHIEVMLKKNASIKKNDKYLHSNSVEVFKGPEFDKLSKNQQQILLTQEFSISKDNNRMAYQLEQPLENNLDAIITSLVLPGTVQLTPSGKLIVLMRDCQTTGGYPRVLQLKESTMNIMAQKFMGNKVCFKLLDTY
ncbi:5-oxoprolinase subunit C family protein [Confluentibacter flavum]|uniref:Allophanate hydrolase n=1 Tax=Confluentibacter flavum TaxID=1909700 RepID=A0A2N3HMN2_9FLAO|nr:biotin-dependent carboxyltransferase family protein [Confluentibacter flavum]PKQ46239.1 allophanate hydrolase [Confluentibacter flavum]